jgi:pilus assembly protein CpaF
VRLEARRPNADQIGEVTIRDLVRNALRMRPDRLVIGETRGPEALDLLMALTTGHTGSFTTVHAAHAEGAIRRLHLLASLADAAISATVITELIADAVDLVVHVERRGSARRITEVAEVASDAGLRCVTRWAAP